MIFFEGEAWLRFNSASTTGEAGELTRGDGRAHLGGDGREARSMAVTAL